MKTNILISLIGCTIFSSFTKAPLSAYKVVPVITKHVFCLNGGTRSMLGGKSRGFVKVDLPPNTVEWYYSVTTSSQKSDPSTTNLTSQLTCLLGPDRGIASNAVPSIDVPAGSEPCDVYLMTDSVEAKKFVNKIPARSAIMNDSRQNYLSGVVQVKDILSGSCFLSIMNPSGMDGIAITVEVSAIVKNTPRRSNPYRRNSYLHKAIAEY